MVVNRLSRRLAIASVALCAATVMAAVPASARAERPDDSGRHGHGWLDVLTDHLSSPKGITLAPTGDPVVAQGGFGAPGPVLLYVLHGRHRGATIPLTDSRRFGDIASGPKGT